MIVIPEDSDCVIPEDSNCVIPEDSDCVIPEDSDCVAIRRYLTTQDYADGTSKNHKNTIRKTAKKFVIKNDTLYYPTSVDSINQSSRQVISSAQQKRDIIKQCHMVNGVDGHFGIRKTTSVLQARFYWKGLVKDVEDFVKTCDSCQREDPSLHKVSATLHPIPVKAEF